MRKFCYREKVISKCLNQEQFFQYNDATLFSICFENLYNTYIPRHIGYFCDFGHIVCSSTASITILAKRPLSCCYLQQHCALYQKSFLTDWITCQGEKRKRIFFFTTCFSVSVKSRARRPLVFESCYNLDKDLYEEMKPF